jgi:hypothetical protein
MGVVRQVPGNENHVTSKGEKRKQVTVLWYRNTKSQHSHCQHTLHIGSFFGFVFWGRDTLYSPGWPQILNLSLPSDGIIDMYYHTLHTGSFQKILRPRPIKSEGKDQSPEDSNVQAGLTASCTVLRGPSMALELTHTVTSAKIVGANSPLLPARQAPTTGARHLDTLRLRVRCCVCGEKFSSPWGQ